MKAVEPLTEEQITELMNGAFPRTKCSPAYIKFARLVEAAVRSSYRWADAAAAADSNVVPIGRDPSRPGDLVPLANGRSVDLGGRWTMPT